MSYKITTNTVITNAYCDRCKTDLKFVWGENKFPQFDNALHISFEGGYGEYIDTAECIGSKPITLQLCKTCADILLEENDWLIPFFNKIGSMYKRDI
jgi:hypothetical protein